ncbi:MAG: plastocyanin/azurin family copper-binding protein [Opitutaceae bacterium]
MIRGFPAIFTPLGRAILLVGALALAACREPVRATTPKASVPTVRTIEIRVDDSMRYSTTLLFAGRGEKLRLVLRNVGKAPLAEMGHNWLLLRRGVDAEEFVGGAVLAKDTGYVPAERRADIFATTRMLGAGETDEIVFNAPTEPGRYVYVCTFPGHYGLGMKGVLTVQ